MHRRRPFVLPALLGLLLSVLAPAAASADPSERAQQRATGYYLALGDSLAAGYQPTTGDDKDGGYVGGVAAAVRLSSPKTRLVNLACSGETVVTMVDGGGCDYAKGSQLAAAQQFLHAHGRFTRVITLDIGANDVQRCVRSGGIDLVCVQGGLRDVATTLPGVVAALRAGAPNARIVVLNYFNPFLAAYLTGPAGQALAAQSTELQRQLNSIIAGAAAGNARVADVAGAFRSTDTTPVTDPVIGTVPTNVATICALTWMCVRQDIHANDAGYAVMASTVVGVLVRERATAA
ncbi:MAG TPA: GDSL-type esterase/lipase family protein [Dermatophilaceae bacterium]|nr:GDSL-type esterase/lipase family protein [Dermatophilaceae bacterium]